MPLLRELSYTELTKKLKKYGFQYFRSGKGSHELWVRHSDGKAIPVPHHKGKSIRKGTISAIIRELGISTKEFFS
jgi:predicted RNA binding protein YcfA (HicA-like mRNA interferase family)